MMCSICSICSNLFNFYFCRIVQNGKRFVEQFSFAEQKKKVNILDLQKKLIFIDFIKNNRLYRIKKWMMIDYDKLH